MKQSRCFLELCCFFDDPKMAIWSLVPLPFLNTAWTSGSSLFTYCWSLAWRIFSIILLACESEVVQLCLTLCDPVDCNLPGSSIHGILQARILEWIAISFSRDLPDPGIEPGSPALQADAQTRCEVVWTFSGIPFFGDWNENWPFPVLWPLLNFPNLLAYWVHTLTASSFRIWSSATGIPSPPLALFIVTHLKACLTSHSRMSASRWVITPLWLSESLRSLLYSSVYFGHFFLALF